MSHGDDSSEIHLLDIWSMSNILFPKAQWSTVVKTPTILGHFF